MAASPQLLDGFLRLSKTFEDSTLDPLAREAGAVGDVALREFLQQGYTTRHALEVVLGIGTYTMSTLANRLTGAPVDEPR
jgi:alkylhydroperoxidase family enzyme